MEDSHRFGWDPKFGTPGTIECCKAEVRYYGGYEIDDVIAREMLDGIPQRRRVYPSKFFRVTDD